MLWFYFLELVALHFNHLNTKLLFYQKTSFKHDSIQINCLYVRCVYQLDFDYLYYVMYLRYINILGCVKDEM